jgi:kumamolisin
MAVQRHPLRGSERQPLHSATLIGPANPAERLEVSVLLRPNATSDLQARVERLNHGDYSVAPLSREALAASHGASAADIAAVERFAATHHLAVVNTSASRRKTMSIRRVPIAAARAR